MRRLLPVVALAWLATACGHAARVTHPPTQSSTGGTTTATAPTTTAPLGTSQGELLVRVYFLRDGKIAPVGRTVTPPAVAAGALRELASGPSAGEGAQGFTSEAQDISSAVTIENGVASVDIGDISHAGLAQIVYTLTQFPTIHAVRTSRMLGDAKPLTRADFEDVTPAILVDSPLPGEAVASPLRVYGTANTFEATFDLAVLNSSGVRVAWRFVTASSGSGTRGTYDTTISFPHTGGPITLLAYEPSAENGKPLHTVRIPLRER